MEQSTADTPHPLGARVLVEAEVIGLLGGGSHYRVRIPHSGGLVPVVIPAAGVRAVSDSGPF